ncbi:AraC family transcriptional regulator [Kineosporia sp. NBRC 101677]|uniref:AraC family transcriptional regulator n=1 Tax=Kineosporia sp. NBRC 101677 TaxID=3032197 RepID=UPI0024A5C310|nr:AraC family transcriptional regulator [Kineosporia sp. NBRC 101677]GLY16650.1 AraC family transcriptional regulator [Kineosporia sp. NBRC 101677]
MVARRDGFENQRLCVVPRPLVEAALRSPLTRRLVVTDAGYFPKAKDHLRNRPDGTPEMILMLCIQGAGWVSAGDQRIDVTPSTCVVIPTHMAHEYGSSERHPWTIWWCHLRGSEVREVPELLDAQGAVAKIVLRSLDRATALLDEIVSILERGQTPSHLTAASGVAWHLLTQLIVDRALPENGTPLQRAIRYLEERTDSTIAVPELAALVGLSSSHLSALFRQATGGGVTAYHLSLRMARARALLDTTTMPIGEVARAVGYHDPLYFSRQFHKLHGETPTSYRALHKG